MRGWAILGVLLVHTTIYGHNTFPASITRFLGQGARGVQLFYIISALTLFMSYKYRINKELNVDLNFFIRRFFRIAPVFYLGIIYYIFQNGLHTDFASGYNFILNRWNIISSVLFVHGFSPFWIDSVVPGGWSIAVEMTFYAFVPFFFKRIKSLNQAFVFFLICIISSFTLTQIIKYFVPYGEGIWHDYLFLYFPSQLPVFALGIILYFLINDHQKKGEFEVRINSIIMLIFILIVTARHLPVHIWVSFFFVFFVLLLSFREYKLLVNNLICFIGKISYSIYIFHLGILYWMNKFNMIDYLQPINLRNISINFCVRFLLLSLFSISFSYISYKLIEQPSQKLGKKLIMSLDSKKEFRLFKWS